MSGRIQVWDARPNAGILTQSPAPGTAAIFGIMCCGRVASDDCTRAMCDVASPASGSRCALGSARSAAAASLIGGILGTFIGWLPAFGIRIGLSAPGEIPAEPPPSARQS
jgi:hypothetical protein